MALVAASRSSTWSEHAFERLADAGYLRGGARRAIIDLLAQQECALPATAIEERLRGSERAVARATIYRVLDQLEQLGLVARIDVGDAMSRYEAVQPDGEHHHHVVCDVCGTLSPFTDAALERQIKRITSRVGVEVHEHIVTLRGTCERCRQA